METKTKVLVELLQSLKKVRQNLHIVIGSLRMKNSVEKDINRSYSSMKSLLESLVVKTIEKKKDDEDIASVCDHQQNSQSMNPVFESLMSSEQYLVVAKSLPTSTPKLPTLQNNLTTFQEFLADILHSVCQIGSSHMKFPSGILVKDVSELKHLYSSIWELAFSLKKVQDPYVTDTGLDSQEVQTQIATAQKSVHSCLREMAKVKLHIEHYFKRNIIEIQLTESDNEDGIENSDTVSNTEVQKNNKQDIQLVKVNGSQSSTELKFNQPNVDHNSFWVNIDTDNLKPPKTLFPETADFISENCLFSSKSCDESGFNNINIPEKTCGDFLSQDLIYSSDFLVLDPTSFYFCQKVNVGKKNSLPKIYSVDSVAEEKGSPPMKVSNDLSEPSFNIKSDMDYCHDKRSSTETNLPLNNSENDLFKNDFSENDSYRSFKWPSVFESSPDGDVNVGDNFNATPLKIVQSDSSYSKIFQDVEDLFAIEENQHSASNKFYKFGYSKNNDKINLSGKRYQKHFFLNEADKAWKDGGEVVQKSRNRKDNRENHEKLKQFECRNDKSLVELFRTVETNQSNNDSLSEKNSKFCMWPVNKDYINVGGVRRPLNCQSVSSDGSVPLGRTFEKSFFSLHLNKKYKQKPHYDGDILLLDKLNQLAIQNSSNSSLINKPYIVSKEEKQVVNRNKRNTESAFGESFDKKENKINKNTALVVLNGAENQNKFDLGGKKEHFNNCAVPFEMKKKYVGEENIDLFNMNSYNQNDNWNAYISVYTSKLGQSTHVNHQRIFRKVINTFQTESLTCNILGNVHTLMSNSGPFRLFDVNGYPLTDSSGNVLKDPYGKSVVILDSTGFPKGNSIVFDAVGHSPSDVGFDPTQKPKTNSIIIKLTDNFKRPLHLYDKYDRPLTDSNGTLLVNIHGRPLLRFDSFGRPNTDYRGGPLYTDNGQRWSYKANPALLNQSSTETLSAQNLHLTSEDICEESVSGNLALQDKNNLKDETGCSKVESSKQQETKISFLGNSSNLWAKVDTVLPMQRFSKEKELGPKSSQDNITLNGEYLPKNQNHLETKDFLKSIIYHDNIVNRNNSALFQSINENNCFYNFQTNDYSFLGNIPVLEAENKAKCTQCISNNCFLEWLDKREKSIQSFGYCNNKIPLKREYSISFLYKPAKQNIQSPTKCTAIKESYCFETPAQLDKPRRDVLKSVFRPTSEETNLLNDIKGFSEKSIFPQRKITFLKSSTQIHAPICCKKYTALNPRSSLPLTDHKYLNKLCTNILKQQDSYHSRINASVRQELMKTKDLLEDTSFIEFFNRNESKYFSDLSATESPLNFSDTCRKLSQEIKNLKSYKNNHKRHTNRLDTYEKERKLSEIKKSSGDYVYKDKNKLETEKETLLNKKKKQITASSKKENLQASSEEAELTVNVLNQEDKHFEIKVTEILNKLRPNWFPPTRKSDMKTKSNCILLQAEKDLSEKNMCSVKQISNIGIPQPDQENKFEGRKEDSLFRYPSDDETECTKSKIAPLDEKKCKSDSNLSKKHEQSRLDQNNHKHNMNRASKAQQQNKEVQRSKKDKNVKTKTSTGKNATMKKQSSMNQECNLVSFFGSPVKYVLSKLDSKRQSKPFNNAIIIESEKGNRFVRKKNSTSKSTEKHQTEMNRNTKMKTLYVKPSRQSMLSSHEKAAIKEKNEKALYKRQNELAAFQSKSCTDLICVRDSLTMTYSGNNEEIPKIDILPSTSTGLQKSLSTSSHTTPEISKVFHLRSAGKSQEDVQTPITQQYYFSSDKYKRRSSTREKSGKDTKETPRNREKSSSPTRTKKQKHKEISLFKKVEPTGKYMLKIKK